MDIDMTLDLDAFGWSETWAAAFANCGESDSVPGRVIREHRGGYLLALATGEVPARVSGRFRHEARAKADYPAVGDWVAVQPAKNASRTIIHAVLPRYSAFTRQAAGIKSEEQVVAANVDTVFLVSGLDHNFNPRRIERYLTLAHESGVDPVVVLNKADLHCDPGSACEQVSAVAYGLPILLVSATTGQGLDGLQETLGSGRTAALLGSSGVGKSSLVNALLGEEMLATSPVREEDSKGRHTTTHRELIVLPEGGILIDTPGMREIQLVGDEASLSQAFEEITDLAEDCRFRDCSHTNEPGCAVQTALADGELEAERYDSYLKQQKEIRHHQMEQDVRLRKEEKNRWKAIHRSMGVHHKRD